MLKVAWLSRHEMSPSQKESLEQHLGEKIEVSHRNITWRASEDYEKDELENMKTWGTLFRYDVIAGVFPPVALSAARYVNTPLYSSVSKQSPKEREDSTAQVTHEHLRWEPVINGANIIHSLGQILD